MVKSFQFVDSGRTYQCRVEEPRGARTQAWWWFDVSEDGQRYAPFEAASGDTEDTVRTRIVAYYDHMLQRRAEPPAQRQHWARRTKPAAPVDAAAPNGDSAPASA
jgi:hypothetical protein